MPMYRRNRIRTGLVAAALGAAAVACASPSLAAPSVQERLDALERKVDSRGLIDLMTRVDQLQQELQQLHGDIELQNRTLEDLKRSQRDQYVDIDRRLQQLESGQPGAAAPGATPPVTPPVAPAPTVTPPAADTAATPEKRFDFSPAGNPPPPPAPVTPADNPVDEKAEYDTALAILRDGRYSDAALAFKQFITAHPTGSYTDNAYYWLGETYYVTRDFDQAQATFRELTTRFPQSPKVADSHLKLGFIDYEKQDWKAARTELETVVNSWPTSTAARLATERLDRMKRERH